jgi:multicomponent Na+:H+ antiporter subunit B
METFVASVLLTFLAITAIGIIVLKDLLAGVILLGVYSLIAAGAFVVMDAVDVAFTEAAVGSGISTILFLGALSFTKHEQKKRSHDSLIALVFVVITGGVLIYGTLDMPHYGDANSAAQTHPELAVRFIEVSGSEVGPPNIVTSVLASYRGYDTLGETLVVFVAGIAVLSLLGLKRRRPEEDVPVDAPGDVPGTGHPGAAGADDAQKHY